LNKRAAPDSVKQEYGIDSTSEFMFLEDPDIRQRYMRECFVKEINYIFGEQQDKRYKKEEFKVFLSDVSDKGGFWLLDNNLIRSRIEKYIK
jgi:hypothetical protein